MFEKIKDLWEDIKDWWTDRSPLEHTNGEEITNGFLSGSGQSFWCYVIIIGFYCLITKQKCALTFTKR